MFKVLADCGDSTIVQWAFSEVASADRETQGYQDVEAELSPTLNMGDKRGLREKENTFSGELLLFQARWYNIPTTLALSRSLHNTT